MEPNNIYSALLEGNICPFCGGTVPQLEWHIVCKILDLDEKINQILSSIETIKKEEEQ